MSEKRSRSSIPEERLDRLLALVKDEPLEEAPLAARVARTARRQLRMKALLATFVDIAGAAGDVLAFMIGERRRREGR